MLYSTKIRALREEYIELIKYCDLNDQVSFRMYIDNVYKKTLLLSAASFFETTIKLTIHNFIEEATHQNSEIVAFVDNKVLNRQYHQFFEWDGNNTNCFFGLFGNDLKNAAKKAINEKNLHNAELAFLAIGHERNRLVHQNYIEAQINDTFEEIWSKYEEACNFVEFITQFLKI